MVRVRLTFVPCGTLMELWTVLQELTALAERQRMAICPRCWPEGDVRSRKVEAPRRMCQRHPSQLSLPLQTALPRAASCSQKSSETPLLKGKSDQNLRYNGSCGSGQP